MVPIFSQNVLIASIVLSGVVEIPSSIKVISLYSHIFSNLWGNHEKVFKTCFNQFISLENTQAESFFDFVII